MPLRTRDSAVFRAVVLLLAGIAAAPAAQAPSAPERQLPATARFDVTSVKPSLLERARVSALGNRLAASGQSLRSYIALAYGVPRYRIVGGPGWIDGDTYDIEATAAADTRLIFVAHANGVRLSPFPLLENLLADRFALRLRRETRDVDAYALVRATPDWRPGPGLQQVEVACKPYRRGEDTSGPFCRIGMTPMGFEATGYDWKSGVLLAAISTAVDREVIDQTGITGSFDIRLRWGDPALTATDSPQGEESRVALFTALREQLGLRLVSTRAPGTILVVESVTRPSPN
jgi:uncharacterized protein (TIGR03435 family)